jgi:opacity protein-like surface antigen
MSGNVFIFFRAGQKSYARIAALLFKKEFYMNRKYLIFAASISALLNSGSGFAATQLPPFYVAASAGVFQGNFNSSYTDLTDVVPQNIVQGFQQNGYTEGLAIGVTHLFAEQYVLGAEASLNFNSHNANYQSGSANAAFSDTVQVTHDFAFTLVPGIMLGKNIEAYFKLGVARAYVSDSLVSPTGYTPTIMTFNSSQNVTGFAGGLGIKKFICRNFSVFAEGNYRDYGTLKFSGFQNFTANYANTSHLLTYNVVVGGAYSF